MCTRIARVSWPITWIGSCSCTFNFTPTHSVKPHAPARAHSSAVFSPGSCSFEELACLRVVRILYNIMADSPLSTPGTPRTMSPFPSEGDLARSRSPPQDDAHAFGMHVQPEGGWTSAPAPSTVNAPASGEQVMVPKGKEKAAKGPLKLLDLPMDILKEIIHQVSRSIISAAPCMRHSSGGR
jgi:hypothetical protein